MNDDGVTQLSSDLMVRITRGERADGTFATFGYDELGLLTRIAPPARPAYSMTSDVRGNLLSMTMPSGEETVYTFDLDYRFSGMTLGDGREVSATYDESNRVDAVVLDGSTFDYTYVSTGQLAGVTGGDADVALTWDGPLPTSQTASGAASGSVGWTWADTTLRLESVDINGTEIGYAYDEDGVPLQIGDQILDYAARTTFLTSREVGGVETTYGYNEFGELDFMRLRSGGADLMRMDYTYDTLGRITEIEENDQGNTTTYTYSYDEIGQLVLCSGSNQCCVLFRRYICSRWRARTSNCDRWRGVWWNGFIRELWNTNTFGPLARLQRSRFETSAGRWIH